MSGDNLTVEQTQHFFGCCPSLHTNRDKAFSVALGIILMISSLAVANAIYPSAMAFVIAGGGIVLGSIPIMIACKKDSPVTHPVVQLRNCEDPLAKVRVDHFREVEGNMGRYSCISPALVMAAQKNCSPVVERSISVVIGGVIGSCLGKATHGREPQSQGYRVPKFSWEWTMDASLMLCLIESYGSEGFCDAQFLLSMYDCFVYGHNCYNLPLDAYYHDLEMLDIPSIMDTSNYYPTTKPGYAGCGPLIRNGPVAIAAETVEQAREFAAKQCRVTHLDDTTIASCELMAEILFHAINSERADPERIKKELKSKLPVKAPILEELRMAFDCVFTTYSFKEAVLKAATRGGEAIAVASIAAQLAGAIYRRGGKTGIPQEWIDKVQQYDRGGEIAAHAYGLTK